MKYIVAIVTTCLLYFTARPQFIYTPRKNIGSIRSSIDKHETSHIKDSIPFSAIRIIDSRYDTTGMGFLLDSYLVFDRPGQSLALQEVVDKYYHSLYSQGKDTLVVELNDLYIQERVMTDTLFANTAGQVSCRLYCGAKDRYKYLGIVDSSMSERYDLHKNFKANRNGRHINYEFWDYYLLRLLEAIIRHSAIAADQTDTSTDILYYTPGEIKEKGFQKRNKPILTEDSLRPGFYRNFDEFVNNNPTFLFTDKEMLRRLLDVMHYRVGKEISKEAPDTSYWGFCTGKRLFIRNQYNFYELERRDAAFYIAPTLDARRQDITHSGINILVGLAVLTVGLAADKSVHAEGFDLIKPMVIPLISIPCQNYFIPGLRLDWNSGSIVF